MNKGDLIESMAKQSGMSKADAGRALDACIDAITGSLMKGERVSVPDRIGEEKLNSRIELSEQVDQRSISLIDLVD